MEKIDFRKIMKPLYLPPTGRFTTIDVPPLRYLMINGKGDPGTSANYLSALQALYAVSYALKFMSKALGRDYAVPPLEGLWWADDMGAFTSGKREDWRWTMMIMVPDWLEEKIVTDAIVAAKAKKGNPAIDQIRLETLVEGLCLQIMHIGSYADEAPVLQHLHHQVMPEGGYEFNGKHHEIYIGDPRKTAPEKLKTVLRQPVVKR